MCLATSVVATPLFHFCLVRTCPVMSAFGCFCVVSYLFRFLLVFVKCVIVCVWCLFYFVLYVCVVVLCSGLCYVCVCVSVCPPL